MNTSEENINIALAKALELLGIQSYISVPLLVKLNLTVKEKLKVEQELVNFICFLAVADKKRSSTISITSSIAEAALNEANMSAGYYEFVPCRTHIGDETSNSCVAIAGSTPEWVFLSREWERFLPELVRRPNVVGSPLLCLDVYLCLC